MTTSTAPVGPRPIPTTRILLIAAGLPLLAVAVGVGLTVAWIPQLPQRIAMHWGLGGADGYADRSTAPLLLAIVGFGLPLLLTALLLVNLRRAFGVVQKVLAAVSAGVGLMLAVVFTSTVAIQRGLTDASQAPSVVPWVLAGAGVGLVTGVVAWLALPRASRTRADGSSGEPHPARPMTLAPGERAVWLGAARFAPWAIALLIVAVVAVSVVMILSCLVLGGGVAWLLLLLPILIVVLALGSLEWKVRVDAAGLHVRSLLGWPRWDIPTAEIASAGTVDVAAVADFGGWGLRWWGNRVGIITRSGDALEVSRRNNCSFTITLDDASAAAELLSAGTAALRTQ